MRRSKQYFTLIALLLVVCAPFWALGADKRSPVKIEGKTFLPLRVLARPFSNIYKEPDVNKGTVEENVPTFQTYYVYTRPEVKATGTDVNGWYEVGSDVRGTVLGWMRAEDVMEWKQTMSLAYTHPEGRKPVLMFEDREVLLKLEKATEDQRKKDTETLYTTLDTGKIPTDFPVRSVEPKKAVDISSQFYLLPILEFGVIELENREGRILKLAAATAAGPDAREDSDIKKNEDYKKEALEGKTSIDLEKLKTLEVDLVFVMDMTGSMQPYINAALDVVKNISLFVTKDAEIKKSVHFGLWGYRDSVQDIPALEFHTKNFTPTLQSVEEFEKTLSGVRAAAVGSGDYPEDVFSGMDNAMRETQWTADALRFIVLIGDAPAHELGHPWNYSGQSEQTLRAFADDNKVFIFALHIKDPDPRAAEFHVISEPQFRTLSRNKGMEGESSYYSVTSTDLDGFSRATRDIAEVLVAMVAQAKKGQVFTSTATAVSTGSPQKPTEARTLAAKMGYAALVEWIGKETETKAPRDIIAWAVDKDLVDPSIQSMDVRLLINKKDLDSLAKVLGDVIAAGRRGQIGGEDFFTSLQATATTLSRTPEQIRNAQSMADLVPEFLAGLPYKSRLMAMNNELWASWSNDQQDEFLKELDAKIQLYKTIHDEPGGWIQLNKGDDPDEFVYPISLEMLP
jgi:hypothetical protein